MTQQIILAMALIKIGANGGDFKTAITLAPK